MFVGNSVALSNIWSIILISDSACQSIEASDEQLDVLNEVWYSMLLNTGQVTKGRAPNLVETLFSYLW